MADWNSALYMKFEHERTRAARDLLAQIPEFEPERIFDLGCGPGNGAQLLTTAFPRATIVGHAVVGDLATAATLSAFGFLVGPFIYLGHEMAWDHYGSPRESALALPTPTKLLPAPA
jgi:SAM-dependent methyltransferase